MAGEYRRLRDGLDGEDGIAACIPQDFCTQRPQTVSGCLNVPVGVRAAQTSFVFCKSGANQQPVRLGFGGDGCYRSPELCWLDDNIHAYSPASTKAASFSTGVGIISHRPISRGIIRFTVPPLRFLSLSIK